MFTVKDFKQVMNAMVEDSQLVHAGFAEGNTSVPEQAISEDSDGM
jgi:hypothetical protein